MSGEKHPSKQRLRRQRPSSVKSRCCVANAVSMVVVATVALFLLLVPNIHAQFNEPPGQRREQTYRIEEFEVSNVNQHYPGDLRYYCTFRGKWNRERHPNDFPKSASWSEQVLISHSKDWRMWTGTETVTSGVEYMAEEGFPTILYNEFSNAGYETLQMVIGTRMHNTSESQQLPPINVTYTHPWLSAMTKIIPSPDWFVGFSDFRSISYDTETFYNRVVIKSYVWDAGTDDGRNYLSFDRDLDPQVPCMRFCVPPFMGEGGEGTYDTNIIHQPGANSIHHPTSNTHKCPDKEKGRVEVPRAGQFLDYSASYIPYPAEYECVLRVGDGDVFAGSKFDEDQIRPPKFVARPNDDFLEGISPYDQPAYDNYVDSLNEEEPEEEPWNKNWLWLLVFVLLCCCPCVLVLIFLLYAMRRKKQEQVCEEEKSELFLDMFVDEGVVPEDDDDLEDDNYNDRDASVGTSTYANDNIDDYDDPDGEGNRLVRDSTKSMSTAGGGSYYGDDNGYGFDRSYNTGVSAGDDYDSWLSQRSNRTSGPNIDDDNGNDNGPNIEDDNGNDNDTDSNDGSRSGSDDERKEEESADDIYDSGGESEDVSQPNSKASLQPPSMTSLGGKEVI